MHQLLSVQAKKKPAATPDSRLRVLFDNTNEHAICMLDASGSVLSWNLSAERLTGYPTREVRGKSFSMFFSSEEIRRGVFEKTLARVSKKGSHIAEGIFVRKDGTHFWARTYLTLVKPSVRSVPVYVLITQDISQRHASDQRRDEYIGIASHELKTPVTTLSLYSELLAKRLELDRDKRNLRMLRDIQGQAARLASLVDDLLVVSKVQGGDLTLHKETCDPYVLLSKVIRDFQNIYPLHKIVLEKGSACKVRADKDRITQVIVNLLSNAAKYSPTGSKIHVRAACRGQKCTISIQDYGIGIAKNDQVNIFTRFFRAPDVSLGTVAGSGLGLYISKEIIKRHRERLWVQSAPSKGTTFFFTLPLSP